MEIRPHLHISPKKKKKILCLGFTVQQKFTFCFLRGPVISVCGPVCSHNPRCQTTSVRSPHPAARTKEVTASPCQTAVTAWRQPAKWTAPVKASRAAPPASIARLPVSLNPRGPLMLFSAYVVAFKAAFFLAPSLGSVSESTKNLNSGWGHGVCQRPVQSQHRPRDHR